MSGIFVDPDPESGSRNRAFARKIMAAFLAAVILSAVSYAIGRRGSVVRPSVATWHLTTVFGGATLTVPVAAAVAPNGNVFVAQEGGIIKEFDNLADTTATTVIDLSTETYNFQTPEHGMLGLAVDNAYGSGRNYIYALYSRDSKTKGGTAGQWSDDCPNDHQSKGCVTWARLVRIGVNTTTHVSTGTTTLIDAWCNQFTHIIGTVKMGPDGNLYAGAGDGGNYGVPKPSGHTLSDQPDYGQFNSSGNGSATNCGDANTGDVHTSQGGSLRAQAIRVGGDAEMNGGIVRVDPDTGAPISTNPFYNLPSATTAQKSMISLGMRNPFRFNFRPGTHEIWAATAGWNTWEMIQRIKDAQDRVAENFGWPCYEGNARQPIWDGLNENLCESLYTAGASAWTPPAKIYAHGSSIVSGCAGARSSPSGIVFYSGGAGYPTRLNGGLFFSDYDQGCLWAAPPLASGQPDFTKAELVANTFTACGCGSSDLESYTDGTILLVGISSNHVYKLAFS